MKSTMSLPRALLPLFPFLLPYVLLLLVFIGFVVWNGGIVLGKYSHPWGVFGLTFPEMDVVGDKSNHIPQLHIPQIFYFIGFCTVFGFPILVSGPGGPIRLVKTVLSLIAGSWRNVSFSINFMVYNPNGMVPQAGHTIHHLLRMYGDIYSLLHVRNVANRYLEVPRKLTKFLF